MVPFRIQFLISSILGFIKTIESMIKPVSSHSLFISNDQPIILRLQINCVLYSCRFVTPNHKSDLCTTPRTPTPFKNAMEKYGPLQPLVSICDSHWNVARSVYRFINIWLTLQCNVCVCVCVMSAPDSKSWRRHKRSHPKRRWDWLGCCAHDSTWAETQNDGNYESTFIV